MTKTLRSHRVRGSLEHLHFSTPFLPRKQQPSGISYSGPSDTKKWQDNGKEKICGNFQHNLKQRFKRKTFTQSTSTHRRSKREIDTTSKRVMDPIECANNTFTVKYEDDYQVFNNFEVLHQGRVYYYYDYRVTDDGLQVCDSVEYITQLRWQYLVALEKEELPFKNCNVSVDGFFWNMYNYTLFKNFTVFFKPTQQSFTSKDYGVIKGDFAICSAKLSLSCNDHLIKVKYGGQYNVFKNFSLSYHMKHYNYLEYRYRHDTFELCASNDSEIQNIWKSRNSWEKLINEPFCQTFYHIVQKRYYLVSKNFNVFLYRSAQSFNRHEYIVLHGQLIICGKKLKPETSQFTEEDMLLCNDSLIEIKFDDEYKVWNNFSIFYKNEVYDYTEYRVLNDSINICNSTDNYVRDSWKLRNEWVKGRLAFKLCSVEVQILLWNKYTLFKNFTVFHSGTMRSFTSKDYGVIGGYFAICSTKLTLPCNDHLVKVKYSEQYRVFNNFSLSYHNKHYDYREYRFRHNAFELCASNDSRVQASWRARNSWDKISGRLSCLKDLVTITMYYIVNKRFDVFFAGSAQLFQKYEYMVHNRQFLICSEKMKPETSNFTEEDMLLCNDSLIKIKFGDEYKVWNNFSIFYKNKVYHYTEYRVLNDSIHICNSSDNSLRDNWSLRNDFVKKNPVISCKSKLIIVDMYHRKKFQYTVLKDFTLRISVSKQVIPNNAYGVLESKTILVCEEKVKVLLVAPIKLIWIVPLCTLGLSIISLTLLLIVYGMLPELRSLPGMNIMSLGFAFWLWQICHVFYLSLYIRVGEMYKVPCAQLEITARCIVSSLFTNAAVNIYHLRRTFGSNTLIKSGENKWKTFLRYSLFSWGVPVILAIIYIVLVSKDVLSFEQSLNEGYCIHGHDIPGWLAIVEEFGLPCCLLIYIITMFIFTAGRIRNKLKASKNIAQKSNIVRKRRSFVLLLKLSTTTAISWTPLFFANTDYNHYIQVATRTVMYLSGVYVGFAFVFTRKNYQMLKKKYF